jgi:cholesterol oxidase
MSNNWNRRKFISATALTAAALATTGCKKENMPASIDTHVHQRRKIIIIGSGFGGIIAAHRLTEAGHEVTILERGQKWDVGDGTRRIFAPAVGFSPQQLMQLKGDDRSTFLGDVCSNMFAPQVLSVNRYAGVNETYKGNGISVMAPAALGGGTIVYGGIFAQPREDQYNRVFPTEIPYSEMNSKWYPMVEQHFGASNIPDDIAMHHAYHHNERFKEENLAAGFGVERLKLAYDWDRIRDEINGTRVPSSLEGDSMFGCSSGAKNTPDRNYLAWAEATGRLEVKTLQIVKDIAKGYDGQYMVYVHEIDEYGKVVKKINYSTEYLFLAAGSVGTPRLMVKAKAKGFLYGLNDYTGEGWGNNGNSFILRQSLNYPTGQLQAFPPNYACPNFENPIAPIFIEHLAFPIGFECDCLSYFAVGIHSTKGYFKYNKSQDDAILNFPQSTNNSQRIINQAFKATIDKINQVNGGTNSGIIGAIPKSDSCFHPCGGMEIGKATDFYGRVKNYNKLYVIDGSLLPGTSAGANPAMTIAALAERNMEHILNSDL